MSGAIIGIITGIIGAITGILGMIFSLLRSRRDSYDTVNEFLTQIESKEFIEIKSYIYNHNEDNWDAKDKNAAAIVNFFHHWGMLAKRGYLPLWVFESATGSGACRLYECVKPYIETRRQLNHDDTYGEYFEWLYLKLKYKTNSSHMRKH